MTFLALDVGSSSIKGAVLDLDRRSLLHLSRAPFPERISGLPPAYHEVSPAAILDAVQQVLLDLIRVAPEAEGLVLCGQMGGLILTNGHGEALSNYISWMDKRLLEPHPSGTGTYFDVLERRLGPECRQGLGNEVRPGLPLSFLFWLAERGDLPRDVVAASLPEFVVGSLSGSHPAVHASCAPGAIHLATLAWDQGAAERLGLGGIRWPSLASTLEPAGEIKAGARTLRSYPAFGDHPCALLGARLEEKELSINISTGSQASLLASKFELGPYQTRPFFEGKLLKTITHIPAGRALNVLVDLLLEIPKAHGMTIEDPWPYIARAALEAESRSRDLEVDLTFFPGPLGESGRIANIREGNLNVGNLFRAAFSSMAESYHVCALRLSPEQKWRRIVFSGGLAAKMSLLCSLIREKFGVEARFSTTPEETLSGLLSIALAIESRAPSILDAARAG